MIRWSTDQWPVSSSGHLRCKVTMRQRGLSAAQHADCRAQLTAGAQQLDYLRQHANATWVLFAAIYAQNFCALHGPWAYCAFQPLCCTLAHLHCPLSCKKQKTNVFNFAFRPQGFVIDCFCRTSGSTCIVDSRCSQESFLCFLHTNDTKEKIQSYDYVNRLYTVYEHIWVVCMQFLISIHGHTITITP